MTADAVESNTNVASALKAEKWIHERHSVEANSLLFAAGGITYDAHTAQLKIEDHDIDDFVEALIANHSEKIPRYTT